MNLNDGEIPDAAAYREIKENITYIQQRSYLLECYKNGVDLHLHSFPCEKIKKEMTEKGYVMRQAYESAYENDPREQPYTCYFEIK